MKVSQITTAMLKEYLRTEEDEITLEIISEASKSYIKNYTGYIDLDRQEEFSIAYLILCAEFYDNRSYTQDRNYTNKAVDTLLGMHTLNLIPKE